MQDDLAAMIERLRGHKMTPAELFEQRVSFVFGQQDFDSAHQRTKDEIRKHLLETYGCPHSDYDELREALARHQAEIARLREVAIGIPKALREQACTISKTGGTVRIDCENGAEANEVFDWIAAIDPAAVAREVVDMLGG